MFPVRSALVALGAASLVLIGACAAPVPEARFDSRPGPPGPPPPVELAEFYGQQLEFEPCLPYATTDLDEKLFADGRFDCARVQVPVDYTEPDGERGEIALLRVKARGEKIGSLLVDPGGPGNSGMNFVALYGGDVLGQALTKGPVGERFDVIGFDPRGVGASTPKADCYTDAEYDQGKGFLTINLARVLKGSLLTVDAAQHGIALLGASECVDGVVSDYLIDLKAPPADAHCMA